MGESLFRRNSVGSFTATVIDRSDKLKSIQTIGGKSIQDRNPAWVKLTGKCMACNASGEKTIPEEFGTWDALYNAGSIKPKPILESVTLSYTGEWGLAQRLSATIKCFDRQTFEDIRKHFLLPGNHITVKFGYSTSQRWHSDADGDHTVSGFKVATFSFSADDDGSWTGNFIAVTSSEALLSVDMAQGFDAKGLKYNVGGRIDSEEAKTPSSIPEVIAADVQRNGTDSAMRVNPSNSGYVIGGFSGYTPTDKANMVARVVIYTEDHLRRHAISSTFAKWGRGIRSRMNMWDDATDGIHSIYVSLGYVVDRIFNKLVKMSVEKSSKGDKDIGTFQDLKIKFHEKWSKAVLPLRCESGDPTTILILGKGLAQFTDSSGKIFDFNTLRGFENAEADDVKAWDGKYVRLDKILINREVIIAAMEDATKESPNEAESVDVKDTKDEVINVNDFFKKIFKVIEDCTGGALKLVLIHDPDDVERKTIYIVDQSFGGDSEIECFVFNPIDGDGNTRSCNISSNGGSNEYRTSMFIANSKKGDVAAHLRGCEDKLDVGRNEKIIEAQTQWIKLKHNPGMLYTNRFSNTDIASFKSTMVDLYRNAPKSHNQSENINWPGMEINLTINGAYGILPGCAVSTTQLTDDWKAKNIYFMVREVTHKFTNSDWSTEIRGIMSFYHQLTYIEL